MGKNLTYIYYHLSNDDPETKQQNTSHGWKGKKKSFRYLSYEISNVDVIPFPSV